MISIKEMSKEDIIFQILLSLNAGDSFYTEGDHDRVWLAIQQYKKLKANGIINEGSDVS